jgi:hypothetical protein
MGMQRRAYAQSVLWAIIDAYLVAKRNNARYELR